MSNVAIVSDSNSGITQSMAKELGITVMPMPFFVGDKTLYEDIDLSQEEFAQYAPTLPLSTLFFPKNIRYTYADYRQHLEQTNEYACSHHGYSILPCDTDFHNISISVHEGRWAMISKSNAPAIHFVVRYSKLRDAIENYIDAP